MSKPIPPYLTFEQALRTGYVGRMEDESYTRWAKKLPCVVCQQQADDPHHPYDVGFGGKATKVPDYWVIPMCRMHHDFLHRSPKAWEEEHGPQLHHALMTITRAIYEGILK